MRVDVVTIFPSYFDVLELSLIGRARRAGLLDVQVHDLRDYGEGPHRDVDAPPYGGGPGMVMRPGPWWRVLEELTRDAPRPRVLVPTPAGRPFDQELARELSREPWLVFACGRYEGIDARVLERFADDEVCIGDYVLAGGEVAALAILEAVTRLVPGVVGNAASCTDDSFSHGLLEAPAYTRPARFRDREVPDVLLSGDHAAIARWRRRQAVIRTAQRRPELLGRVELDEADRAVLAALPGGPAALVAPSATDVGE